MLRRLLPLILISLTFLLTSGQLESQYTTAQKRSLFDSDTREVIDLWSGWELSTDGESWTTVDLPHTSVTDKPLYFEKTIKLKKSAIERYVWTLEFLGVTEEVEVSVNGNYIEKIFSGGGSFSLNVPEKYLDKEVNTFRLKVYPVPNQTKLAIGSNIYAPEIFTGIERNIFFVGKPKIWVEDFAYDVDFNQSYSRASLELKIDISSKQGDYLKGLNETMMVSAETTDTINPDSIASGPVATNSSSKIYLTTRLIDKSGTEVASSEAKGVTIDPDRTISQAIKLSLSNPLMWFPKQPNLYKLELTLSATPAGEPIDKISYHVGFKDLQIEGNSFTLNGVPFMPKGVNYTSPFSPDSVSLPSLLERDMNNVKSLGANLLLFNKGLPHPYLAHLCDKYGLLMMVDLPVEGIPSGMLIEDNFKVRTLNIAERLIAQLDNSVSMMGWGLYSSLASDSQSIDFTNYIYNSVKPLTDKLIYATTSDNSFVSPEVDFVVVRIPTSQRNFEQIAQSVNTALSTDTRPHVIRYGVAIKTQHTYGWEDQQSEEYQGHYLKNVYSILNQYKGTGSVVDYYRDFKLRNPLLTVNKEDLYLATAGLISQSGQEKVAYRVIKAFYNDEKQPLISAGEAKTDSPIVFTILSIVLIIVVLLMLNRYRRFREYFTRSIIRPYNFYSDIRDQRIMSTARTFIIGFVVASSMALFVSALIYNFKTTEMLQTILMLLIPFKSVLDFIVRISWQPLLMFIFFTSIFFMLMFVISFVIKIFGIFSRYRINFGDTMTISIWAAIPFLVMLPVTMVIPKLLDISEVMVLVTVLFGLALGIWIFIRILNATAVVLDKALPSVYIVGLSFLIILILLPVIIFQSSYAFLDYVGFFFETYRA